MMSKTQYRIYNTMGLAAIAIFTLIPAEPRGYAMAVAGVIMLIIAHLERPSK
jgi:hypothetical protein